MRFFPTFLLLFALACAALPGANAAGSFRAGAAAIDITPKKLGVSMTGSFQDRTAIAVADRLHARGLVIDDGKTRVAIVVCDICLISREIFDEAKAEASKQTGIPVNRMMMSATHTHSAPTAVPLAQCNPTPEYVAQLTAGIAKAVVEANAGLKPARIGWASGIERREINNRRWYVKEGQIAANPFGRSDDKVRTNPSPGSNILVRPAGPVDPEVAILSVVNGEGRPIALLANYGLHYVGGVKPGHLSADYFGEFARQAQAFLKADDSFVGIMSNGASGDVNNYNFLKPRPATVPMERIGVVARRVAVVTYHAWRDMKHSDGVKVTMVERAIDLGVRKPSADEVAAAKQMLAKAADPKRLKMDEIYAQETVRIDDYPETVNVKLQALRVGGLGIVAIPCEVFAEIGLEIKSRSPLKSTFVIALANGYNGYLPSPAQHELGGYETWRSGWSYLETEASTKIIETTLEMLGVLAKGTRSGGN